MLGTRCCLWSSCCRTSAAAPAGTWMSEEYLDAPAPFILTQEPGNSAARPGWDEKIRARKSQLQQQINAMQSTTQALKQEIPQLEAERDAVDRAIKKQHLCFMPLILVVILLMQAAPYYAANGIAVYTIGLALTLGAITALAVYYRSMSKATPQAEGSTLPSQATAPGSGTRHQSDSVAASQPLVRDPWEYMRGPHADCVLAAAQKMAANMLQLANEDICQHCGSSTACATCGEKTSQAMRCAKQAQQQAVVWQLESNACKARSELWHVRYMNTSQKKSLAESHKQLHYIYLYVAMFLAENGMGLILARMISGAARHAGRARLAQSAQIMLYICMTSIYAVLLCICIIWTIVTIVSYIFNFLAGDSKRQSKEVALQPVSDSAVSNNHNKHLV